MKDITILPDTTIGDAMRALNKTAEKCLLVVDENKKLLGSLTDGDLRRSILNGIKISEDISSSYNTKPTIFLKNKFNEEEAKALVQQTFRGATLLWESQKVAPETLRQQVSSPGGTTLAALNHFQSKNVGESIQEGMRKAFQRAKELSS